MWWANAFSAHPNSRLNNVTQMHNMRHVAISKILVTHSHMSIRYSMKVTISLLSYGHYYCTDISRARNLHSHACTNRMKIRDTMLSLVRRCWCCVYLTLSSRYQFELKNVCAHGWRSWWCHSAVVTTRMWCYLLIFYGK